MTHSDDNRSSALEDGVTAAGAQNPDNDQHFIQIFRQSIAQTSDFHETKLQTAWSRNYRAFSNRHMNGSKYESSRYRNRSKLFKSKTRAAVRKNNAAAASALFSTEDAVSITAERPSDKLSASTARWLYEALNYRLSRDNFFSGPNWFLTAVGAREDTQLTGICVSKQYWEYQTKMVAIEVTEINQVPALDPMGQPMLDEMGQPVMKAETTVSTQQQPEVIRDRLMITLIPPEHAHIDTTGDWRDPIQEGGFFAAAYPVRANDIEAVINEQAERNVMGGSRWRKIDLKKISQGRHENRANSAAVRRSRGDGIDRYDTTMKGKDNDVIWLHECFYRENGQDWHWWMLGRTELLSDPTPTEDAYPALEGRRPYVRGIGELETHKTHPMAPVESWQQMQQEINDITNLYLDGMKMGISPITKVKKGRNIDLKQVQNRGPDAAILVEDEDDVTFDRAPTPDSSAIQSVNVISNDMDDLAGVFSGSSVQSNRALNETVGGMKMLSNNANALTEFDLKVWVETWVQPVLAQCVANIRYYESSETVLAVAGEKAGLIENLIADQQDTTAGLDPQLAEKRAQLPGEEKITLDMVLGHLDKAQVSIKVNVGLGAMDSQAKMEKFGVGLNMTKEMMPILKEQGVQPNAAALLQEGWGIAGYKDADRFFTTVKQENPEPPPEVQLKMMEIKAQAAKTQADNQTKMAIEKAKIDLERQKMMIEALSKIAERGDKQMEMEHQGQMAEHQAKSKMGEGMAKKAEGDKVRAEADQMKAQQGDKQSDIAVAKMMIDLIKEMMRAPSGLDPQQGQAAPPPDQQQLPPPPMPGAGGPMPQMMG